jgi:hypothetical protein
MNQNPFLGGIVKDYHSQTTQSGIESIMLFLVPSHALNKFAGKFESIWLMCAMIWRLLSAIGD